MVVGCARANGDPATITKASRNFVRMIRHIVMAVRVIAGVRAPIRGASPSGAGGTTRAGITGGAAAAGGERWRFPSAV